MSAPVSAPAPPIDAAATPTGAAGRTLARPPRLSLRIAVPLAALLVSVLVSATGLWTTWQAQVAAFEQHAQGQARLELHRLTQHADNQVEGQVTVDLMQEIGALAAQPQVEAVALVDEQGRIRLAHLRSWRGQPAADRIPGWSAERHRRALHQREVDLHWDAERNHLNALLAYLTPVFDLGASRQLTPAVIAIRLDLGPSRAELAWGVLRQRLPDLLGVAMLLALLTAWLTHSVSQPLHGLMRTSRRWASGDLGARATESGLAEISQLARAFNHMALDLQQGQADLRASEQHLSTIVYSTGDALVVVDRQLHITLMNPVATALTGWTEAEARGRAVTDVLTFEDAASGRPLTLPLQQALDSGDAAASPAQAVLVSRSGSRSPIADRAAPVRNAEGELTGVVLLMRDVSAAYRLEQALAESERHHRTLANAGHALIWTTDRSGHPTWANQPWQAFCGEAEPGAWLERVHPDDQERAALDWRACVQHSEAMRLSLRLRRHDGTCRWMTLEAVPRSDSQGAPIGHIVFAVDTSREHETKQRLRDQLAELQRWQAAMFGREQRISALKAEVNLLLSAHGQPPRYPSQSGNLIDPSQHDRALSPTPTDPSARA